MKKLIALILTTQLLACATLTPQESLNYTVEAAKLTNAAIYVNDALFPTLDKALREGQFTNEEIEALQKDFDALADLVHLIKSNNGETLILSGLQIDDIVASAEDVYRSMENKIKAHFNEYSLETRRELRALRANLLTLKLSHERLRNREDINDATQTITNVLQIIAAASKLAPLL